MRTVLTQLRIDHSGATAIEYALVAGLISILCVGWAMSIGTSIIGFFTEVATGL